MFFSEASRPSYFCRERLVCYSEVSGVFQICSPREGITFILFYWKVKSKNDMMYSILGTLRPQYQISQLQYYFYYRMHSF